MRALIKAAAAAAIVITTFAVFGPLTESGAAPAGTTGPKPTLTLTSSATVEPGDIPNLEGTGCIDFEFANVQAIFDFGGPDENVIGVDFPISVDSEGNFSSDSIAIPADALPGDVFTFRAVCGDPTSGNPPSDPVTVTVPGGSSSTSSSTTPSSTTSTTMPGTTTPPASRPATAQSGQPNFTG
jgi:hypothetical protein